MIGEALYVICKAYFTIAGLYFIYSWYVKDMDTFAWVTGFMAILFMITNIKWYFFKR